MKKVLRLLVVLVAICAFAFVSVVAASGEKSGAASADTKAAAKKDTSKAKKTDKAAKPAAKATGAKKKPANLPDEGC
jgi:uncharacterized protein (UPF0333 family)